MTSLDKLCIGTVDPGCADPTTATFSCELPAESPEEAARMLEVIGSSGIGVGSELWKLGVNMPELRSEYTQRINELVVEVERRKAARQSAKEIAQWAVVERRRIATEMRIRSGLGTTVLFEIRDWSKYGLGGRNLKNMEKHYLGKGHSGNKLYPAMVSGAGSPNTGISDTAIKGANHLKHGGRVIVVLSVATTAYTLLTAPEDELERMIYAEVGGAAGGLLGSGAGVGICLVFGIASGGWGLLACGVVGGAAGGVGGNIAGNKIYSATHNEEQQLLDTAVIFESQLDGGMCGP